VAEPFVPDNVALLLPLLRVRWASSPTDGR